MLHSGYFFLLRRPKQPVRQAINIHEALARNRQPESILKEYYQSCRFAGEAIYLASPALYDRYNQWLSGETLSEKEQLLTTLYQYMIRMSTRCTPYGLFAGCGVAYINNRHKTERREQIELVRYYRPDTLCIDSIETWLSSQPEIRSQLPIRTSSSLYSTGSDLRYIEQYTHEGMQQSAVTAVEHNVFLEIILDKATYGTTLPELVDVLRKEGFSQTESEHFLLGLLQEKILTFDFGSKDSRSNRLRGLITLLKTLHGTETALRRLQRLDQLLNIPEKGVKQLQQATQLMGASGCDISQKNLVHADAFFDAGNSSLNETITEQIARQLWRLTVLSQRTVIPHLEEFKRRFNTRYELAEIPLCLALDLDTGIGYGTDHLMSGDNDGALVDDLTIFPASKERPERAPWWTNFVLDKFIDAITEKKEEILLTDTDLTYLAGKTAENKNESATLPYSCYAFGSLLANSAEAAENGMFRFNLLNCGGPSALPLMGRFACGSNELESLLKQCAAREEAFHEDVILAEIVHKPEGRVANVTEHPPFYKHEIPYLGQASVADPYRIPVSDLMVCVRQGKVILRSKKLNKRIIPRLSNAHNYHTGLPVYRFLSDLQYQDSDLNIRWDWADLESRSYLPRVRYQNIIIRRARWLLNAEDFREVDEAGAADILNSHQIPEKFVMIEGDNELLIDRTVPYSVKILLETLRKKRRLRVAEYLFTPENCWLQLNGNRYASEMVIPMYNSAARPLRGFSIHKAEDKQRTFPIGSQWYYLKLYAGGKPGELVLRNKIYPIVEKYIADRTFSKFFFVRYFDPEPHIRLRFEGHLRFYRHVIRELYDHLHDQLQTGAIRIQADTYQRELERYGAKRIALCEHFFHLDSMAILMFLDLTPSLPDEQARFMYAVKRTGHILLHAGLSTQECSELMESLKESFFLEFDGDSALRKKLGSKFRQYRNSIEQTLSHKEMHHPGRLARSIIDLTRSTNSRKELLELLPSLIHMTINRIFISRQRLYELVLYHCLAKHYTSLCVRKENSRSD